ncbi:hypothetical protein HUO13_35580 [Saccharopolyspora erythraea]|uniref:hypothetical protein n=1 Tax=Saccharopolyspora erythraea TaxID=1836 RepID=UPI001BAA9D97|nr:hypothetical protein [Saccharopolyspora erythraea]QUH05396.1 hypothetical protein HUO13_35580 [Saccharopolyspora erythraea]
MLVRAAQWELDDAAHEISRGCYTDEQRAALAEQLVALAQVLSARPDEPIVVEHAPDHP